MKRIPSAVLFSILILLLVIVFAPILQAQDDIYLPLVGGSETLVASAQKDKPPEEEAAPPQDPPPDGPPTVFQTEVVAPLPLPVAGSVDIPNGIDANVTNFPATQDVRITNAAPLNVHIVPAREPVQVGGQSQIIAGEFNNSGNALTYDVPAGKRLVVEYASIRAFYLNGTGNPNEQMDASLFLELGGEGNLFELGRLSEVAGTTGIKNQVLSKSVRLYADPGTTVKFIVYREDPTEEVLVNQELSGYLEAVP